jgi:hypothetical protein
VPIAGALSDIVITGSDGYANGVALDPTVSYLSTGELAIPIPGGFTSGSIKVSGVRVLLDNFTSLLQFCIKITVLGRIGLFKPIPKLVCNEVHF